MKKSNALVLIAALLPFAAHATDPAPALTTIEITDQPVVKDVARFGVNIGGDSYYAPAMLKVRKTLNFEGTTYRQCHDGNFQDASGASTFYPIKEQYGWSNIYIGADFTILSGPAKGQRGKIKGISKKVTPHQWQKGQFSTNWFFEFAEPVKMPDDAPVWNKAGLLVEKWLLEEGAAPYDRGGHWWTTNTLFVNGDVPPGSFGKTAALLTHDGQPKTRSGYIRLPTVYQRYTDTRGQWLIRFWAKIKDGSPTCQLTPSYGAAQKVELSNDWKKYELTFQSLEVPEPKDEKNEPHLTFMLEIKNGAVLVDDIEVIMADDNSPTPFVKQVVDIFKDAKLGGIRFLQMGGSTMESSLRSPLQRVAGDNNLWANVGPNSSQDAVDYSLGDLCALTEYLGAEPWYSVPGTLRVEEMDLLMEYLGAPATVGAGKWRAEQGHPKPWTDSLKRINIEFGNEAWNMMGGFQAGGYNGPDYWNDLIARAKKSPYFRDNVKFVAAGQNAANEMSARILKDTPLADRYAVAPYIVHSLDPEDMPYLDTPEKMFSWLYGQGISYMTRNMAKQKEVIQKTGVEFNVYEINHHITGGKAPLELRNQMVTSQGGALNVINGMLILLKDFGMRTQNFFTFAQKEYNAHGVGNVRLWGGVLSTREGQFRYRPTWLALTLANSALAGDLVATTASGENPKCSGTGLHFQGAAKNAASTYEYPAIWSYAFADGKKRSLILFNLDVTTAHPAAITFAGEATGAVSLQWLTADSILANNEYEVGEPQVSIREEPLAKFTSGQQLTLPPHSMVSINWNVK